MNNEYEIVIIGLGPSGLGAASVLSKSSIASRVLCIEQGDSISNRTCQAYTNGKCKHEQPCQVISGFGGSSLLSGGKISAFPAGSGLTNILGDSVVAEKKLKHTIQVLGTYLPIQSSTEDQKKISEAQRYFSSLGFEYKHYNVSQFTPNDLIKAYNNIYTYLKSTGMNFSLNSCLTDVDREGDRFRLSVINGSKTTVYFARNLVIGVGRSGQKTINRLNSKLKLGDKKGHLDIGVRLEFPTKILPTLSWYHRDLKLLFNGARTFCVCKDGQLAPYFVDGVCYIDGSHNPIITSKYSNLGILVRFEPSEQNSTLLSEIQDIAKKRNGKLVFQKLSTYLDKTEQDNDTEIPRNMNSLSKLGKIDDCFPTIVSPMIKKVVLFFVEKLVPMNNWSEISVFAPEVEYSGRSFPVKPDFSILPGISIIGDCTGQFRGIAQAFCSGMVCAEKLLEEYIP